MFRGQCAFAYWQEGTSLGILKVVGHADDESLLHCIHVFVGSFSKYCLCIPKGQCFQSFGDIAVNKMGKVPPLTGAYITL